MPTIMHRWIKSFGLMKLVTTPDVEAGSQSGYSPGNSFASCDGIVGQDDMHEVIEINVGFEAVVAVPDVKAITTRGSREIDADILLEHLCVCRIQRIGQAV